MPPVISIVGRSNSGKTTLIERLIPELKRRGFRVGTVKHYRRPFEMDLPGKDSWRHKNAGAEVSIISSPFRIGIVKELSEELPLESIIRFMEDLDIILTEGYKKGKYPKIEVLNPKFSKEPMIKDGTLIAVITEMEVDLKIPKFNPEKIEEIVDFILSFLRLPMRKE